MKRLALSVNESKPGAAEVAAEIRQELANAGLQTAPPEELAACDALIAVGGDGTILTAARMALPWRKPVLGVNAGRLGFLAGLERHELHLLPRLATGAFTLDRRMLLEVRVSQEETLAYKGFCVNDAVISRFGTPRLAEIAVDCGGGHALNFMGDGVIFATPTGSTAYNFSAGGPVVEPSFESILLTPVCNHLMFTRSVVFTAQTNFSVDITREGLALATDAEPPVALLPGQRVTVRRAEAEALFIRLKTEHFLDVLAGKMGV
ncbi:MAG: NAD(+)/NADH kinase [Firmicutes bacterium]|nr:NAD(+)/NADH kinase [Bacillota bacterium]